MRAIHFALYTKYEGSRALCNKEGVTTQDTELVTCKRCKAIPLFAKYKERQDPEYWRQYAQEARILLDEHIALNAKMHAFADSVFKEKRNYGYNGEPVVRLRMIESNLKACELYESWRDEEREKLQKALEIRARNGA